MSEMNNRQSGLQARAYDPKLFVNREAEMSIIARRVNLARSGGLTDGIVNFWGIRGTGKSWLLQHIHQQYQLDSTAPMSYGRQSFSLLYLFAGTTGQALVDKMVVQLAQQMLAQLDSALPDEERAMLRIAARSADVTLLVQAMRLLLVHFVPVLLLDNAEAVVDEDWQRIEQQLIEPLVTTNRVLCVIAGREYITSWHRFETRRRVKRYHDTMLQPFDKDMALKQIERGEYGVPFDLSAFYAFTAGSPLLLDKFAQEIADWALPQAAIAGREALARNQEQLLTFLRISEHDILGDATEWLPVLNLLSPLRFYRTEALRFMMRELDAEEHPEIYYLDILRELDREADVVWWDRSQRAYVTSPIVRRLMNRRHCLDPSRCERYVEQHRSAYGMYVGWIQQYPLTSEDYICELWFHLASVYLAHQDPAQLQQELQATAGLIDALRLDSRHALQKQFAQDRELQDLLPADAVTQIRQLLAKRL